MIDSHSSNSSKGIHLDGKDFSTLLDEVMEVLEESTAEYVKQNGNKDDHRPMNEIYHELSAIFLAQLLLKTTLSTPFRE